MLPSILPFILFSVNHESTDDDKTGAMLGHFSSIFGLSKIDQKSLLWLESDKPILPN